MKGGVTQILIAYHKFYLLVCSSAWLSEKSGPSLIQGNAHGPTFLPSIFASRIFCLKVNLKAGNPLEAAETVFVRKANATLR